MVTTAKDFEQDRMIRDNAVRISRNEEAIQRQTEALEKIRDHYYPHKPWWKKLMTFFTKVICVIVAYLGVVEALDWMWNTRTSRKLAAEYAAIAQQFFFMEGNADGAAACYLKAIELDGSETEYKTSLMIMKGICLGVDLMDLERPLTNDELTRINEAQTEATVIMKQNPGNPLPHVMMAQLLVLRGEKEAAIAAVDEAVRLRPGDAAIRISSCAMHYFADRRDEARIELAEAELLDPTRPLVLLWKGVFALCDDHDMAAARVCFGELLKRFPNNPQAAAYYGQMLLADKDPDFAAARTYFTRALARDPKLRMALMGMAESYEKEKNPLVARIWLNRVIANDPNHLPAYLARARAAEMLGDHGTAVADLSSAIALAPLRADLYRLRAEAYEQSGNTVCAAADRQIFAALQKSNRTSAGGPR